MLKPLLMAGLAGLLAGCATRGGGAYRPKSHREKRVFKEADRSIRPGQVRTNFYAYVDTTVAWAGIIRDIRYKEQERVIQVAFRVEHRDFDWTDPPHLAAEGEGEFLVGWSAQKPNSISHLKTLAQPGDLLIAYGKPYQMKAGIIQLAASAARPIEIGDFTVDAKKEPDPPTGP